MLAPDYDYDGMTATLGRTAMNIMARRKGNSDTPAVSRVAVLQAAGFHGSGSQSSYQAAVHALLQHHRLRLRVRDAGKSMSSRAPIREIPHSLWQAVKRAIGFLAPKDEKIEEVRRRIKNSAQTPTIGVSSPDYLT